MTALCVALAAAVAAALYLLAAARAGLRATRLELARAREEHEHLLQARAAETSQLRAAEHAARSEAASAQAACAALQAELRGSAEKLQLLDDAQQRLQQSFEALCGRALQANSEQFLQLARESLGALAESARGDLAKRQQAIDELVKPVHKSLEKVDEKIHALEQARTFAYASLSQQVKSLLETQNELRSQTGNLVKALRAPSVRGRWGEIQLQRVVELAGMVEHCDFSQQQTVQGDEGRLRPDLLVKLPGGKTLVVDAKVPLAAYLDALEAQDEPTRRVHLAAHARQLRNHVAQLARKAYWDQLEHTPEFVVLFVPNEAVFAAAMEVDPQLMEGAFSEKVLLASPTTLIALLRAAAFGWRQERLAADAQIIANLGRELHKRLGTLAAHFARVGKALAGAVGAYNDTVGSFEHMVVPGARKLREKAATMDEEIEPLPDVDATPRALAPAEPPPLLPDDAN
jgi:DNA recombination protein RmuC